MDRIMKLPFLLLFAVNFILPASCDLPPEVDRPPKITQNPDETVYAAEKAPLKLTCVAEGVPSIVVPDGYSWTKNGTMLNIVTNSDTSSIEIGSAVMSSVDGSITFWKAEELREQDLMQFEGKYQCSASNKYGKALSNEATIKVASLPYITPQDRKISLEEGAPLSIPCDYKASEDDEITWHFVPKDVGLSKRISQASDGTLAFSNVVAAADDGLTVYCTKKNLATRGHSRDGVHHILTVTPGSSTPRSPQIIYPNAADERRVVLRGKTLELTCIATGNPTPTLKWEKISGAWPDDRTTFKNDGHTVVIKNIRLEDEGHYRCSVENNEEVIKMVDIEVEAKPYFESSAHHPVDLIKAPGDSVTIRCEPSGLPEPTVTWLRNGEEIQQNPDIIVQSNSIRLTNLQKSSSAVYQCLASNKHGSLIQQGYVHVLTWPPVARMGNTFAHSQVESKTLSMKCKVFASPPPVITWIKNGNEITTVGRFNVSGSGHHLRIERLEKDDAGDYTCQAENDFGELPLNFTVDVLSRTLLYLDAKNVSAVRGKPAILNATVKTDPKVTLTGNVIWRKEGKDVGEGNSFEISEVDFSNAGKYMAFVTTSHDEAHNYIDLRVIDCPLPPKPFSFQEITNRSLLFSWTPGNDFGSPIAEYRIDFKGDSYDLDRWQTLMDDIPGNKTSIEIELYPGINYKFRAFARNGVGWSKNATETSKRFKTSDEEPKSPIGFKASGASPNVIDVNWNSVKGRDRNGAGFGYRIRYKPSEADDTYWMSQVLPADESFFEFEGEGPYQEYVIELTSFNDVGDSLDGPLQTTSYTGEDVPAIAPANVSVEVDEMQPTQVLISWDPVPGNSVRGRLLGYRILYSAFSSQSSVSIQTNDTTKNQKRIENLEPDTAYEFKVAACSGAGCEVFSDPVSQKTPKGAPLAGTINVTTDATGAIIMWTASPISSRIPAESVRIEYKEKGKNTWKSTEEKEASSGEIEFTMKLASKTDFVFRAVASNEYGSNYSDAVSTTSNGPDVTSASFTSTVAFIVIMCLVALLIVVIVIICVVKRNKGRKYPVAKKENFHNEAQPLDEEAGDYNDDSDDVKKPLAPGNTNGKQPTRIRGDSVGGDSIDDFDGADPKEFNEDGSFIGQYGVIATPSNENTPVTPPGDEQNGTYNSPGDAV